jgi:hypothetical protein
MTSRQQQHHQQQHHHPSKSMATLYRLREQYQRELAIAEEKKHDDDLHDHDGDDDLDYEDDDNVHRDRDRDHDGNHDSSSSGHESASSSQDERRDDVRMENDGEKSKQQRVGQQQHQQHQQHQQVPLQVHSSPNDVRSIVAFHRHHPGAIDSAPVAPKMFGHDVDLHPNFARQSTQDTEKASNKRERDHGQKKGQDQRHTGNMDDQFVLDPLNPDEADEQSLADLLSDCCPSNDFSSLLGDEGDHDDDDGRSENEHDQAANTGGGRVSSLLLRSVSDEDSSSVHGVPSSVFDWDVEIRPSRSPPAQVWDPDNLSMYCQPVPFGGDCHQGLDDQDESPKSKRARHVEL